MIEILLWTFSAIALIAILTLFRSRHVTAPTVSQERQDILWARFLSALALTAGCGAVLGWTSAVVIVKNHAAEQAAQQIATYKSDSQREIESIIAITKVANEAASLLAQHLDRAKVIETELTKVRDNLDEEKLLTQINGLASRIESISLKTAAVEQVGSDFRRIMDTQLGSLVNDGRLRVRELVVQGNDSEVAITPQSLTMRSRGHDVLLQASSEGSMLMLSAQDARLRIGVNRERPFGEFYARGRRSPLVELQPNDQ